MLRSLFIGCVLLTPLAASAQTPDDVYRTAAMRYDAGLAAQCPDKHLNWIAPGELPDHIDAFETKLGGAVSAKVDQVASTLPGGGEAHCPGVGASCGDTTRIAAYHRLDLLPKFVAFMCALPETCSGQSTCSPSP